MKVNATSLALMLMLSVGGGHFQAASAGTDARVRAVLVRDAPGPATRSEHAYRVIQRKNGLVVLSEVERPDEVVVATNVALEDGVLDVGEWTHVRQVDASSLQDALDVVGRLRAGGLRIAIDAPSAEPATRVPGVDVPPSGIPRLDERKVARDCLAALQGHRMPIWVVVEDGVYAIGCHPVDRSRRSEAVLRVEVNGSDAWISGATIVEYDTLEWSR